EHDAKGAKDREDALNKQLEDLAKVKGDVDAKVKEGADKVKDLEQKLAEAAKAAEELKKLTEMVADLKQTVANKDTIIGQKEDQIADLERKIKALNKEIGGGNRVPPEDEADAAKIVTDIEKAIKQIQAYKDVPQKADKVAELREDAIAKLKRLSKAFAMT